MLSDLDRVRAERRKAKSNRNKYTGVGNDNLSFSSGGGRYGGFGSDSLGGDGGGGYGGGNDGTIYSYLGIQYLVLRIVTLSRLLRWQRRRRWWYIRLLILR